MEFLVIWGFQRYFFLFRPIISNAHLWAGFLEPAGQLKLIYLFLYKSTFPEIKSLKKNTKKNKMKFMINNPNYDTSGTSDRPLNCGWIQGIMNSRGKKAVHRILHLWYESFVHYKRKNNRQWAMRCRD